MSMDRCEGCDRHIDTDVDCDCYRLRSDPSRSWGDDGNYQPEHICLCEWCREQRQLNND